MAKGRNPKPQADHHNQNWQRIFKSLVEILQTQQTQLEELTKERKLLEDRIRIQHNRWVSDVRILEDLISEVKRESSIHELEHSREISKVELVMGLKQREAEIEKLRLEYAETELGDFVRVLVEKDECIEGLRNQLRKMKEENGRLLVEKDSFFNGRRLKRRNSDDDDGDGSKSKLKSKSVVIAPKLFSAKFKVPKLKNNFSSHHSSL
ncbi:hypothetical protein CsatB_025371 [Cannabis sativa]